MNKAENRKFIRADFSGEVKIRIPQEDKDISVGAKDISPKGIRVIVGGRFLKIGTPLEIKIHLQERDILCAGKVVWALTPRPGLGNIIVFDVGIEFTEIGLEDQEFLGKLFGK